jgi:hypothetical protein
MSARTTDEAMTVLGDPLGRIVDEPRLAWRALSSTCTADSHLDRTA